MIYKSTNLLHFNVFSILMIAMFGFITYCFLTITVTPLRWVHKVSVPYQVAMVTNKNNMREVEGVTHHIVISFHEVGIHFISTWWCEGLSVSGL